MMKTNKSQTALQNYLDGLLQEAEIEQFNEPKPVMLEEKPLAPVLLPTFTAPKIVVEQQVEAKIDIEMQPELQPVVDEKPAWSQQPFECLLFDVAGLTLAVPLICLGSIYQLSEDDITPIFAQPEWFVGIMSTPAGNLKVLDTARWVMPERYNPELRKDFSFVISIDGHEWGLAVNQVRNSILLRPDEVKWRLKRGQRAWLAGTVIEHMCALLDVEALAKLITDKDKRVTVDKSL
ncbi:MAG: chemotaxis protein CheW [Gammaproteobacteria bacterium]|nr:chemotaxis protein CheW [Gammaproteobacteria bacterium]